MALTPNERDFHMSVDTSKEARIAALYAYLSDNNEDVELDEISDGYSDNEFEYFNEEYLVLTNDEADELCEERILDSLWAFNKSFLDCHSEAIANIDDDVWQELATNQCENLNETVRKLIDDIDSFVEDAVGADGRGHFISFYDGEEVEVEHNHCDWCIYRV
jgi:hypothetical protein